MANDDKKDEQAQDDQQPSHVRKRVMHHLRKLLTPGVMGLGACKNADTPVVCDPMPPPIDGGAAGPPTSDGTEGNVDPDTRPESSQPPPVVCDPMPAPIPPPPPPDKKK